jgi:hypothetical protein
VYVDVFIYISLFLLGSLANRKVAPLHYSKISSLSETKCTFPIFSELPFYFRHFLNEHIKSISWKSDFLGLTGNLAVYFNVLRKSLAVAQKKLDLSEKLIADLPMPPKRPLPEDHAESPPPADTEFYNPFSIAFLNDLCQNISKTVPTFRYRQMMETP